MSYFQSSSLPLGVLRKANQERLPEFRDKHGHLAHGKPDGSDWSPAQWLQAVVGELGEYANLRKKYERGDLTAEEFREEAARELADVLTYLDILAMRCLDFGNEAHPTGVDLSEATRSKFNEVSNRVRSHIYIGHDFDWHRRNLPEEGAGQPCGTCGGRCEVCDGRGRA